MHVRLLYSRIRRDGKLFLNELRDRGHEVMKIDVRKEQFDLTKLPESFSGLDVVVDRCPVTSRSIYITRFPKSCGIPVVNSHETVDICADKTKDNLALADTSVPTPDVKVVFTIDSAMDITEELGYPCVLKSVAGSWGRLAVKADSESATGTILGRKPTLDSYEHKMLHTQELVERPGRNIRIPATDGELAAAMIRSSNCWLASAVKGAGVDEFELDNRAKEFIKQASDTVGDGLLGVDLMETGDDYTVHEISHTIEFKALDDAVEADVPTTTIDWLGVKIDGAQSLVEVST